MKRNIASNVGAITRYLNGLRARTLSRRKQLVTGPPAWMPTCSYSSVSANETLSLPASG